MDDVKNPALSLIQAKHWVVLFLQYITLLIITWYRRWLSSPEVVVRTATASETFGSSDSENQTGGDCGYVS